MPFLYKNQNPGEPKELKELDIYNRICLDYLYVSRPSSKDEFENYNLIDSYNLSKQRALA